MEAEAFTLTTEDDETIACSINEAYTDRAIVMVHGFGGHRDLSGMKEAATRFVESSYSVVRFDMRGVGDSDGVFEDMTLSTQQEDLETVFAYAAERFDTVAVVGWSMGALIALLSDITPCAHAFWSPSIKLKALIEDTYDIDWEDVLRRDLTALQHPTHDTGLVVGRQFLEEIHALDYVRPLAALETPTLVIHGTEDTVVPHNHSIDMFEQMHCRRELVLLHADHTLRPSRTRAVKETVSWFDEYCGGAA